MLFTLILLAASSVPSAAAGRGEGTQGRGMPDACTVSFFPNGEGDVTGTMPDQTLKTDKDAKIQSNSFIRPGFTLAGWDTDPKAGPDDDLTVKGDKGSASGLASHAGGHVDLYAVWRKLPGSDAEIFIGKTVRNISTADSYSFRIEPVEGWRHDNVSTELSGQSIAADAVPMPEGTPDGQKYKDISITGLAGNAEMLRSGSAGIISFRCPGWSNSPRRRCAHCGNRRPSPAPRRGRPR